MTCWKRLLDYSDEYIANKNGNISFISFLPLYVFLMQVNVDKG